VDRVLEKGRLILLDGPSHRTRHLEIDGGKDSRQNAARISGTHNSNPQPVNYDVFLDILNKAYKCW
jgi:hypothetical protein